MGYLQSVSRTVVLGQCLVHHVWTSAWPARVYYVGTPKVDATSQYQMLSSA